MCAIWSTIFDQKLGHIKYIQILRCTLHTLWELVDLTSETLTRHPESKNDKAKELLQSFGSQGEHSDSPISSVVRLGASGGGGLQAVISERRRLGGCP